MEFINERKKIVLKNFSQSFGKLYEQCPLQAWFSKWEKRVEEEESVPLMVGKEVHRQFAKSVADYVGKPYEQGPDKPYPASVLFECMMLMKRADIKKIAPDPKAIVCFEKMFSYKLDNGIMLNGIMDLCVIKNFNGKAYMEVFDLKTSHKIDGEKKDLQGLIYAFLAATHFGMDIVFKKYSCRTGEISEDFYSVNDALAIKEFLETETSAIKEVIESPEMPKPKASGKCISCPFIEKCSIKHNENLDAESLMNTLQYSSAQAKRAENMLKELRAESKEDIEVNGFTLTEKEGKRKTVKAKGKRLTKKDVIYILLAEGNIGKYINSLDINIDEDVQSKLKELGVEIETSISKRFGVE